MTLELTRRDDFLGIVDIEKGTVQSRLVLSP
jgi:hypothetical protein